MKPYKLMCSLFGHTGDVKSLCVTKGYGGFASVSRDFSAKLWLGKESSNEYNEVQCINAHKKYVNAVAVVYSLEDYPNGLVITGSNDQTICIHEVGTNQMVAQLKDHDGAVCTLNFNNNARNNLLCSGSFDSTAKVWDLNNLKNLTSSLKPSVTIRGHEHTVWSVVSLSRVGCVLTGSADKSIKQWQLNESYTKSDLVCKYTGHSDCVRGLAVRNDEEFFSCSNDGCVLQWRIGQSSPLRTYRVTDSFLYSVNIVYSNESECQFITSGEDRSLRIHSTNSREASACVQTLAVPCQTLWYCLCLPNGNIVVGCSDGSIRIFTQREELMAKRGEVEEYERELAQFAIPVKANESMSQINRTSLPGVEALSFPGRRDGEPLMINNNNEVEVYQWSGVDDRWIKIGVAVGSAGSDSKKSKITYLGKEYDYVFDIQLDDAPHMKLKLPYNLTDDPYMAAQNFIHEHELNQSFLDEIATFIMKNTEGETVYNANSAYYDPFTGENRYVPTSNSSIPQSASTGPLVDPFTGSTAYRAPGTATQPAPTPAPSTTVQPLPNSNEYFPHLSFILFDQMNFDSILKKLKELQANLSAQHSNPLIADTSYLELIEDLVKNHEKADNINQIKDQIDLIFQMIDIWPIDSVFPLLDLVRILVLNKNVAVYLCKDQNANTFLNKNGQHSPNYYFDILFKLLNEEKLVNSMLTLRIFANLFKALDNFKSAQVQKLLAFVLYEKNYLIPKLFKFLPNNNHKMFLISYSTLLLNYTVLNEKLLTFNEKFSTHDLTNLATELIECFNHPELCENLLSWDAEAIFRVLVSAGTLLIKTSPQKDTDYFASVFNSIESLKVVCARIVSKSDKYPEKVSRSAKFLLQLLK